MLGVAYNHAATADIIAFNLKEVKDLFDEYEIPFKVDTDLKRALSDALKAGLIANKVIRSNLDQKRTVRAWVIPMAAVTQH